MKQYIEITCPHCKHDDLVKNGQSENGTQRYRCRACRRSVQWEYTYRAWQPPVKAQIEELTLNGTGVRAMSRTLKIAKATVIAELKKTPAEVNLADAAYLKTEASQGRAVTIEAEADEFWSYVSKKAEQRWTWYVRLTMRRELF